MLILFVLDFPGLGLNKCCCSECKPRAERLWFTRRGGPRAVGQKAAKGYWLEFCCN
jgi:hypothetical protein